MGHRPNHGGDGMIRSAQRSAAASPHRSAAASPHHLHHMGGDDGEGDGAMDKLLDCERTFATLKREGRHLDALPYMEMSVFLRKQIYGANSREVLKACQVFTTSCNTLAMNCLQKDDYMKAYELLKKAELLTEPRGYLTDDKARLKLRAVTFNNLGCFYKRRGKLHAALQYLDKALKIELSSDEVDNPAGTHLNLCATLSQLGRHQPALEHAQCALDLLKQSLSRKGALNGGGKASEEASIISIAYHNLAVEQEHLGQWEDALKSYGESVVMAERQWGPEHPKTHAIRHSFQQAKEKIARKGGRLPALRGGGLPPRGGGGNAATIGIGARDHSRGGAESESAIGHHGRGARHTTLPALGGRRNPRDLGGAVSVPPTHGTWGGGSAPVTPPGGKRPPLRIPPQNYNSAPVSSRGWAGGGRGGGNGVLSPIGHVGAMTGPPGTGIMGGRHSSLGHTYGANQPMPYSNAPPGGGVRFAADLVGGQPSRGLDESDDSAWHGGGEVKTGPRTPGAQTAVRKRPPKGGVARGLSLHRDDEYDDFSAPSSPQTRAAGGTVGVAQFPQHMAGVSAAHFPAAVTSHAHDTRDSSGAEAMFKAKKNDKSGSKSQQELLARVAQLEASLNAMGGASVLGSPTGGKSPGGKGEFKVKCHLDDDVTVLMLPRDLRLADFVETVAEEYGLGVRIKYKDAEGDLVTISTDKGLVLALSDHFSSGADVWHLYLFTAHSPSKQGGGSLFGAVAADAAASAESTHASSKAAQDKYEEFEIGQQTTGRTGGKGGLNAKAKHKQNAAAMLIQSVQRGHLARKDYRVMLESEHEMKAAQREADDAAREEENTREREKEEAERARREAESIAVSRQPVLADADESDDDDSLDKDEVRAYACECVRTRMRIHMRECVCVRAHVRCVCSVGAQC